MRKAYARCLGMLMIMAIAMFATTYVNSYGGRSYMYNNTLTPGEGIDWIHFCQYYQNRVYEFKLITDTQYPLMIEIMDSGENILFSGEASNGQTFYIRPSRRGYVEVSVALTGDEEAGFNLSYTMEDTVDRDVQRDILLFMFPVTILFIISLLIPEKKKELLFPEKPN